MLQGARGGGHHRLAGADLAGQRYLGDVRMRGQKAAGIGEALHDVEDAVRQAGFGHDVGELDRGERRQLGRLEDHRVAAGKGRRRLPAGDLERIVPGADAGDDAKGSRRV